MLNWLKSKPQESKTLGQIGEEIAQQEYKKKGFKIIAKNEYNKKGRRLGEIDFIVANKYQIIFVEVKTRKSEQGLFGTALEAVDVYKQRKILKAVKLYMLHATANRHLQPQIDVCAVILGGVDKASESVKIYPSVVEDWN